MLRSLPFSVCACAIPAALLGGTAASAPSNAPSLSNVAARHEAQSALTALTTKVTEDERAKLEGIYVAFDPSATSLVSLAACDDDGDPVVVLSDAMLALVDAVARARATDDRFPTHKVQDYGLFLGRLQSEGSRTIPPPPGFYETAQTTDPHLRARQDRRRAEAIDALIGHEVAHFVQGDLTCPRPTATHESGDAVWTDAEGRFAQQLAAEMYSASRVLSADATATAWLIAADPRDPTPRAGASDARSDDPEEAYVALLTVFDQLPASSYARFHEVPGTTTAGSVRIGVVRAAAARARSQRAPAAASR